MAKRTISFGDYEEPTWEEYTGEDPPPNKWFTAIAKRAYFDDKEDQIIVIFEISEGDYAGWGRGWYAPLDGDLKWKSQAVIKALQGGVKKDLTLDWDNEKAVAAWIAKTKPVKIKTREYNDKISINRVAPLLESVGAGKAAPAPKEAELPGDTDAGDEPIEDYTAEELAEMDVADLEEVLTEEFEFSADELPEKTKGRGAAAKYKQALIDAILEEQEGGDDEEGDGEDPDDEEFDDGFDDEDADQEPEPEPEPEPAPRTRRSRATKAAPAPAKAAPPAAKATTTRRRRG